MKKARAFRGMQVYGLKQFDLTGKKAFVTGTAVDIGRGCASPWLSRLPLDLVGGRMFPPTS